MISGNSGKSLKSRNLPWLVSLIAFDVVIIVIFAVPTFFTSFSFSQASVARALATLVLPVVVLLLTGVLPHNLKASLVYWKTRHALPAHKAFTKHGPSDARVDMAALQAHLGELPIVPGEQNRLWFKLYKATENTPTVLEAHKMYLLYRDMAAISLLLMIAAFICFYWTGFELSLASVLTGLFALQYGTAAIAARHSGVRFVTNVLAIHSTVPIPPPIASPPKSQRKRKALSSTT
jgi:hypothetical protein